MIVLLNERSLLGNISLPEIFLNVGKFLLQGPEVYSFSYILKLLPVENQDVLLTHMELSNILRAHQDSVSADVILLPPENVVVSFGEYARENPPIPEL